MRILSAIIPVFVMAMCAQAQVPPGTMPPARSVSGQFTVFGPSSSGFLSPVISRTNINLVRLEPTLVAISAERIRQAVWSEIGYAGAWRGRVVISLHAARSADEEPEIDFSRTMAGRNYRVRMADQLSADRYLRAIVQVVLLELANRSAGEQAAEIPSWLTEGLTYHLLANNRVELIIDRPQITVNGVTLSPPVTDDRHRLSRLEKAHKIMLGETPLTFEELSWPAPGQTEGAEGSHFRACAQLLTHELLSLRGGRACMRRFLDELPAHLNWQMAFLAGFSPHFKRPLEIEKWWALQSTGFAGRDLIQTWTYEESWKKLAATLIEPVNVFGATNELPMRAEVKLQAVVRDWEPAKQEPVLRRKLAELEALRLRIAPELGGLVADYAAAIAGYIDSPTKRVTGGRGASWASQPARRSRSELVNRLDVLELRVQKMQPRL